MPSRCRRLSRSTVVVLAWIACFATSYAQDAPTYRGRSLQSVVDEIRAAGLPLVYSTNLLTSELRVDSEPTATDPLGIVREILSPHGLVLRETNGAWLIVRGEPQPREAPTGDVQATVIAAATCDVVRDPLVQVDPPDGPSIAVVDGQSSFPALSVGRHVLTVRAVGYLPERQSFNVMEGVETPLTVRLAAAAPQLDELTVTASRYDLSNESQPSSAYFSRDDIERFSELGNDALRILHRLPGIAASEFSSRSHVRGGASDETTVILDGVKLVEPFHLRDYQSVLSAIDQRIVSGMQVYSGGFPAAYGDALSGLTVIDRVEPTLPLRHELGVSLLYTSALSSGTFADGKGQWLASARLGNVDRLLNDDIGEPRYRDGFFHVGIALSPKHGLALNGFGFDDDITLTPENDPTHTERGSSYTDNDQLWLKLDSDWTETLSSRTILHSINFSSERAGVIDDTDEMIGRVADRRDLSGVGFKQDWRWDRSARHALTWGIDIQDLDGQYRYAAASEFRGIFATLPPPPPPRAYSLSPDGDDYSAFVADTLRVTDRFIVDLGMRWDKRRTCPRPMTSNSVRARASSIGLVLRPTCGSASAASSSRRICSTCKSRTA
jgi:outer membrane receptor protein involved in Fe transport